MIPIGVTLYSLFKPLCNVLHGEQAEYAQQQPGTKTTINPAEDTRKKECKPNETESNSVTLQCATVAISLPQARRYCNTPP